MWQEYIFIWKYKYYGNSKEILQIGKVMDKKNLINQNIDYILQDFDEDISVGDVADYFHFSKYYICRVFKEETGESIYALMKRLKMDQSAISIKLEKNKAITDIGLDYGYIQNLYQSRHIDDRRVIMDLRIPINRAKIQKWKYRFFSIIRIVQTGWLGKPKNKKVEGLGMFDIRKIQAQVIYDAVKAVSNDEKARKIVYGELGAGCFRRQCRLSEIYHEQIRK